MQAINEQRNHLSNQTLIDSNLADFSTFYLAKRLYGIDVTQVQEVVKPLPITPIPLADAYVSGLINLRGQVATAIDLGKLLGLEKLSSESKMNVVCTIDGALVSLQVDEIDDVISVLKQDMDPAPLTIDLNIRRFISGIYKVSGQLLSIISTEKIAKFLNQKS